MKVDSSRADNLRVNLPLGDTGRFGPSGDLARGDMKDGEAAEKILRSRNTDR
jgi:hypothetical protein